MSFLQNLLSSLKDNVARLEAEVEQHNLGAPQIWDTDKSRGFDDPEHLIPWPAFEAIEKVCIDARALEAAVIPNHFKLLQLGLQPARTSALNVAVSLGVTDAIEELGGSASLTQLADKLSVNKNKLGRIIRTLTADYIYQETSLDVFKNNRHSRNLQKSSSIAQFMSLLSHESLLSSSGLLKDMTDPSTKNSFAEGTAPFCSTVAQHGETFFEYIAQPSHTDMATKVMNGVVPWLNRTTRQPLLVDYPWDENPVAHVIDVGCGPGDSGLDILRKNPRLRWTFQDLPPVIESLKASFPADLAPKFADGSIQCIEQDYFEENISEGDIWYLRGVMREYEDEDAIKVFRNIIKAMKKTPGAKMVINEVLTSSAVISSANGTVDSEVPSRLIPTKQSKLADIANLMTWNTFFFFGGVERSFQETEDVLQRAGLKITRFFPFRSFTTMIECTVA